MPRKMKWALVTTWKHVSEFATKKEAQESLEAWKQAMELRGMSVSGSKTAGAMFARFAGADYLGELARAHKGEPPLNVASAVIMKIEEVRV